MEITEVLRSVLKEELQPVKLELEKLNHRVGKLEGHVEKIEHRVGSLEKHVKTIEADVNQLKEVTSNIQAKQQIVFEQTAKLTEYHNETQARFAQLATKDDLSYFDQKIGRHEREIFNIKNA